MLKNERAFKKLFCNYSSNFLKGYMSKVNVLMHKDPFVCIVKVYGRVKNYLKDLKYTYVKLC